MISRSDGTFALRVRGNDVRGTYAVFTIRIATTSAAPAFIQVSGRRFGPLGLHDERPWQVWTITHLATGLKLYGDLKRPLAEDALRILLASDIGWSSITSWEHAQRPRMATRIRRVLRYIDRRHTYLRVLLRRQDRRRPRRGRRLKKGSRSRI